MGIRANELRIGNILSDGVISPVIIINVMHNQVVCNYTQKTEYQGWFFIDYDTLQPISLTEEILLMCGFKETKNLVGVRASYTFRGIRVSLSNSGYWYFKQRIIYLHDLQNIVFALYGKELEVNL